MRTVTVALLLLAAPAVRAERPVDAARRALLDASDPRVLVVSHRGYTVDAPENSIAAIVAAAELGADVVEIDVRRTADGTYVLMHDKTVNRTTPAKGDVAKMTLDAFRRLRLLDGARPTASMAPTLAEAFDAARGRVLLNLDPKEMDFPAVATLAREADVIDHCIFKWNWPKVDEAIRAWLASSPDVQFVPVCASLAEVRDALAFRAWPTIEVTFATTEDALYDPATIASLRAAGTRLWVNPLADGKWTGGLKDADALGDATGADALYGGLVRRGYGVIQTDLPERAIPAVRAATTRPAR